MIIAIILFMLGYFFSGARMAGGAKDDVDIFDSRLSWNPLNLVFRPSLLTPAGRTARKWNIVCLMGVFASFTLLIAFDL